MLSTNCTHIRIRHTNDYDIDVPRFIRSVEKEYNIKFTSLPRWEELVQRLQVSATDCKRKIQAAQWRKAMIIDKLYMQSTRPSPFELSDGLCRTESKWRQMEMDLKKRKVSLAPSLIVTPMNKEEIAKVEPYKIAHPNTENLSSASPIELEVIPVKIDVSVQADTQASSRLPVVICTNPHKLISPLGSQFSALSYKSLLPEVEEVIEEEKDDWLHFKSTSSIICTPMPIIITNNTLKRQSVQFSVTNCTDEYMHIRYKGVTDRSPFKSSKLLPAIPKRLYPGIGVVYKFIFTLKNQEEFKSSLYFRVGRIVFDNMPTESFCIPIVSAFTIARSVSVTESVTIPSVYSWHIKRDSMYPTGTVEISVNDPYCYHLHICKRKVDLSFDSDVIMSLQASGPNTASVVERTGDHQVDVKTIASSVKGDGVQSEKYKSLNNTDVMALIADDIIQLALEAFIFESTYLYLKPYSKVKIPVYFTKAEYVGLHQSYYDFEFVDPKTETVMMTKTSMIFAEILPHPLRIDPVILDMSKSPVSHGYCQDHFVVTNSHKVYPSYIKIKLTTKMKRMFYVEPMDAVIPTQASVTFAVKFCSRDFLSVHPSEDLVHFTFKIVANGYKAVYEGMPRLFYEVIAPCAVEFKKVYNEKYFKED